MFKHLPCECKERLPSEVKFAVVQKWIRWFSVLGVVTVNGQHMSLIQFKRLTPIISSTLNHEEGSISTLPLLLIYSTRLRSYYGFWAMNIAS